MQRRKEATAGGERDTVYFFRMSAFKFPGPNDVYFSCSVDVCSDCNFKVCFDPLQEPRSSGASHLFKEICPDNGNVVRTIRRRRSSGNDTVDGILTLHDHISIRDAAPLSGPFQILNVRIHLQ